MFIFVEWKSTYKIYYTISDNSYFKKRETIRPDLGILELSCVENQEKHNDDFWKVSDACLKESLKRVKDILYQTLFSYEGGKELLLHEWHRDAQYARTSLHGILAGWRPIQQEA